MTTEHQTAPDFPERRQPDGGGSGDKTDDGALDPSVFFGLFDDLDNKSGGTADESDGSDLAEDPELTDESDLAYENRTDVEEADDLPTDETILAVDDSAETLDAPSDVDSSTGPESNGNPANAMDLDAVIGMVLGADAGTDPATPDFADTDDATATDDASHVVHPDGDGVHTKHKDDGVQQAPFFGQVGPTAFGNSAGETTVEAGGPASKPNDAVPSPPRLPVQPEPESPAMLVDDSYGTYQSPPLLSDHDVTHPEDVTHDSGSVVLGDLGEATPDPFNSASDYATTPGVFEPQSDTYRNEEHRAPAHQYDEQVVRPLEQQPAQYKDRSRDSSLTVTAVVMTIAASFAVGLIGLAAMFALTDGDDGAISQETEAEEATSSTSQSDQAAPADAADDPAAETDSDVQPDPSDATPDTIDVNGEAAVDEGGTINPLLDPVGAMASALGADRLDLLALEFTPGTEALTAQSAALLETLGPRIADAGVPVTITVRATGESTAQSNLDLSTRRAEALVAALVAAGAPEAQVRAIGLGAGPLSAALPVPDFVAATPELGDAAFSDAVAASGPFTIGSRFNGPGSFRVEAITDAARLRQAMDRFTDSTIGLAAYSFFAPDNESARVAAGQLADTVVSELTSGEVGSERITVITPGAAPYVITPELGGHVWLQTGPETALAFEVAGLDTSAIAFEAGTATLTAEGQATMDQLASVMSVEPGSLTVAVRTYSQAEPEANTTLSQQQAAEIARYLVEVGGIDQARLRTFGSGPSTYYPSDGASTTTLTVGPAS